MKALTLKGRYAIDRDYAKKRNLKIWKSVEMAAGTAIFVASAWIVAELIYGWLV